MVLKDSADAYMALLSFCSTPIPWCYCFPEELLMGQKLKSDVAVSKTKLKPHWKFMNLFINEDIGIQEGSKADL